MSEMNSVVAVYKTHTAAEEAIKELQRSGFDMKKMSIVGKDYHTACNSQPDCIRQLIPLLTRPPGNRRQVYCKGIVVKTASKISQSEDRVARWMAVALLYRSSRN